MNVWVKICGIRRGRDAEAAVQAGADAIGVNFYERSRRVATTEQAREVVDAVPPGFLVYGVFVDAGRERIRETIARTGIRGVQLHGSEPIAETSGWEVPVLYARGVGDPLGEELAALIARKGAAAAEPRLLLDNPAGGGSGSPFDSRVLERAGVRDLSACVVAGGLTPANVAAVVARFTPFGVDTAGGVETAPGIKDSGLIEEFVHHARNA